jgi:hypothetical protein
LNRYLEVVVADVLVVRVRDAGEDLAEGQVGRWVGR